jgi:hypothetical protein
MPEWVLATGMVAWGLIALASSTVFSSQEFFQALSEFMPFMAWGALAVLVGVVRLIFLVINGAWRPSAHIRAVGCFAGSLFWGSLLIASLKLTWLTPNTAIFATALGLDLISLSFASGDAKLADLRARSNLKV